MNPARDAGKTHVLFSGKALVAAADPRLVKLHAQLEAAMVPTKLAVADMRAALGARNKVSLQRIPRTQRTSATVGYMRKYRGANVFGPMQRRGRNPMGVRALTAAQRKALQRAREALKSVVCELRNK